MHLEDTALQVRHAYVNLKVRWNKEANKYKRKYKTDIKEIGKGKGKVTSLQARYGPEGG